jgi:hypothetical protein
MQFNKQRWADARNPGHAQWRGFDQAVKGRV